MPLARTRDYLSIGEVLDAVRPEFPDVSISKIRFLETEGLLQPERTASGYRKFYEPDVKRLRYVLSLQKEHFLPLKVIKERLRNGEGEPDPGPPPPRRRTKGEAAPDLTGVQLDRKELQKASGLTEAEMSSLEDFGLMAGAGSYDEHDLMLAKAFAGFLHLGVEARHLKMYKQFADREAALFEQMVSPLTRRRSEEGPRKAGETVAELIGLARKVKEELLRSSLKALL